MTDTHTTDQVAELFQARAGQHRGQAQPFRNVRVEATGYVREQGRHAGAEVFLVHHDGNKPEEVTAGSSWHREGAHAVYVKDGQLAYTWQALGESLRTVKALVARERREDAKYAQEAKLHQAAVLAHRALPANAVPEAHGFHLLSAQERGRLREGSLVLAHGHGRWRVAVVTKVSRTGSVSYLFTTPAAVKQFGPANAPLTGGTTKAGDNLYGG